jgi:hypothetical protein
VSSVEINQSGGRVGRAEGVHGSDAKPQEVFGSHAQALEPRIWRISSPRAAATAPRTHNFVEGDR